MPRLSLLLLLSWHTVVAMALSTPPRTILVIGASGGTGWRALSGMLDAGLRADQIRVVSRDPTKPAMQKLRDKGFETCQADLANVDSLATALEGCGGCYIHSTSSDTPKLDVGEEERARNLATAIAAQSSKQPMAVVYNSAAGEPDHGVTRTQQKQNVEAIFRNEFPNIPFTALRANLFMEELWKGYTRPGILKGKFSFSLPSDRQIYLTSVKDMGHLAGTCLLSKGAKAGRTINVASDALTAAEIADAFAKAQGSPCVHKRGHLFAFFTRLFFRDLFQQIRFYRRSTEVTDIDALKKEFPGHLTSFSDFLQETNWGNADLTFDDLSIASEKVAV